MRNYWILSHIVGIWNTVSLREKKEYCKIWNMEYCKISAICVAPIATCDADYRN